MRASVRPSVRPKYNGKCQWNVVWTSVEWSVVIIMPPTSKKLEGHIASGTFVRACVRPSVTLFDA